jgi:hypothetical protein
MPQPVKAVNPKTGSPDTSIRQNNDIFPEKFPQKSINLKRNIHFSPILKGICKRTVSVAHMVT